VDLYTAKVPNVLYAIVPHYSKARKCRVILTPLAAVGAAYFGCPYTAHVAPRQQASHCKLQPVWCNSDFELFHRIMPMSCPMYGMPHVADTTNAMRWEYSVLTRFTILC